MTTSPTTKPLTKVQRRRTTTYTPLQLSPRILQRLAALRQTYHANDTVIIAAAIDLLFIATRKETPCPPPDDTTQLPPQRPYAAGSPEHISKPCARWLARLNYPSPPTSGIQSRPSSKAPQSQPNETHNP